MKTKTTLDSLRANPRNPRIITDQQRALLKDALADFGDLGGVCFNRQTKQLVGGHQRVEAFRADPDAKVTITERLKRPDRVGTLAWGFVETNGTRYSYREVSWSERKERAANLAANKHGGDFDEDQLKSLLADMDDTERLLAGFQDFELEALGLEGGDVKPALTPEEAKRTLAERFGVPPFTVLDARQGYWQDRKRAWIALGIKSELGRGGDLLLQAAQVTTEGLNYYRNRAADKLAPGGSPEPLARLRMGKQSIMGKRKK